MKTRGVYNLDGSVLVTYGNKEVVFRIDNTMTSAECERYWDASFELLNFQDTSRIALHECFTDYNGL